jgi:hypothetical protein
VVSQPFTISNETTHESLETPEEFSETTQTTMDGISSAGQGGATAEDLQGWLDPPTDAGGSWDDAAVDLTAWGDKPSVEDDDKVWGSTPAWKMDIPKGGWDAPTSLDDWGTPPKTPTPEDRPKTPRPKTPIPEAKLIPSQPRTPVPENTPESPQPRWTRKGKHKAEKVEKSGNEDRAESSKKVDAGFSKQKFDADSSSKKRKLDDSLSRKQKLNAASSSKKEKPKRAVSSGAVVVIGETLVPDTPRRFEADISFAIPPSNQQLPVGIGCIIPSAEKQAEIMEASRKVVIENRQSHKVPPQDQLAKVYEPAADGSDWMIGKTREWRPDPSRAFSQRSKPVGDAQWVDRRWPMPGE